MWFAIEKIPGTTVTARPENQDIPILSCWSQSLLFDYFCLPRDDNFSLLINLDRL